MEHMIFFFLNIYEHHGKGSWKGIIIYYQGIFDHLFYKQGSWEGIIIYYRGILDCLFYKLGSWEGMPPSPTTSGLLVVIFD